jgi:predicted metal-dependent enzyme (double-stranded beta helix superfamily)/catechol 2,3-dioxygenase-like lactoylglutathione lyase family enzyme
MDILNQLLNDTRQAIDSGQDAVSQVLRSALSDHERLGAAIRTRSKPWFFAADEAITIFCTEGRPGNASSPHDHGSWSVLGCFDGSEESWWHQTDETSGLRHVGSGVLRAGEAHALPADAIHAVMNRWDTPNGIIHIYQGNFLAAERHIWDPVTHARSPASLSEPLAPSHIPSSGGAITDESSVKPALAGTAFAAIAVNDLAGATDWMASVFGLHVLTTQDDSCAVDEQFSYLIEPSSLTVVGLHRASKPQSSAGLEHIALRVPSVTQLERWHQELTGLGHKPSPITPWNFGTFVEVIGPEGLTVRLFVPTVK